MKAKFKSIKGKKLQMW